MIDEEVKEHLAENLKAYQGKDYALAYVLHVLRSAISPWLFESNLDPNTYTYDQQTLLVISVMCEAGMRVN
jgi:hypothetical protein